MMTQTELARWLKEQFTGERLRARWRALLESCWEEILATKSVELLPPERLEALVKAYLTKEKIVDVVRPVIRGQLMPGVEMSRDDHQKLGRWVPDEARLAIHALVSQRGFVDTEWVRSVFKEEAIEAILSDTIYAAIRDFSAILPRLIQTQVLGRLGRLGGLGGGLGTRVLEEVEKLLEPEIRRYLDKGTRKALDGAARFAVDHLEDPVSVAFRRNMVDFVLDQEVAFHTRALSDEVLAEIDRIAALIAIHVAEREESKLKAEEVIARAYREYGDRTLGSVLEELGVAKTPPLGAWADATWPILAKMLDSKAANAFVEDVAAELFSVMNPAPEGHSA